MTAEIAKKYYVQKKQKKTAQKWIFDYRNLAQDVENLVKYGKSSREIMCRSCASLRFQ